jgi:hypothetical protein
MIQNQFWIHKLKRCKTALEQNNFEAFIADDPDGAKALVIDVILPKLGSEVISWGDSMTLYATGLLEYFTQNDRFTVIETFAPGLSREDSIPRRRQAMLSDLFLTGTNAVTETGVLVNLDMIGNRVAGVTFGPRDVILFVGRNKIVRDVDTAMRRIKTVAAPMNAMRHNIKTPCVKTARCMECASPARICNTWTIHAKSYPQGRIKVVLINQDLGL